MSEVLSCRVPKTLAEKVKTEAKKGGFISVSDYLRSLLRENVLVTS